MSTSSSASEIGIQNTLPIPDTSADLDTFWRYVEEGMDHVFFGERVLYSRLLPLYTVVYRYMESITVKEGIKDPQSNILIHSTATVDINTFLTQRMRWGSLFTTD